jgi:UDP-N-acetylmuramoylalanine--D-glutamate ligase
MNLSNKNVLVVGLGSSGIAAANRAVELGANVAAYDDSDVQNELLLNLKKIGIKKISAKNGLLNNIDLLITSPGVPVRSSILRNASSLEIPIISELEFAYRQTNNRIIAVTGTNGKSSTVTLIGQILTAAGKDCIVAGNIGLPFTEALKKAKSETIFVLEVSSFQLEFSPRFHPHTSMILNIAEDHIDWHGSFEDYIKAKLKIFSNQIEGDFALINLDDEVLSGRINSLDDLKVNLLTFGVDGAADFFTEKNILYYKDYKICSIDNLKLVGKHNISNILGAVAAAYLNGVDSRYIQETVDNFSGLGHRIDFIGELNGVKYYDDSKATNPHATMAALGSFDKPVILLLGGKNKDNDFQQLAKFAGERAEKIFLFGEAAPVIAKYLPEKVRPFITKTLAETVTKVRETANKGDIVLLSPACASFDEFQNYKERGRAFKKAVFKQ